MSPNIKTLSSLQEDEIINLLYKTQINFYLDSPTISYLISRSFVSQNKEFRKSIISYLKLDTDRFLKLIELWCSENTADFTIKKPIKIDKCTIEPASNFIEESLVSVGEDSIDKLILMLKSNVYTLRIFVLRSLIYLLNKNKDKIFRNTFDNYIDSIIDFCIEYFGDNLIKIEVCRFLGNINSKESVSMLEYFRDIETDFTIKMISIIGLDNIQKMSRSNANRDNSGIKNVILGYRR